MAFTIESLETYARCPRKYKFKYIDKAEHYITSRELFQMAHRKALHEYLHKLKAGKTSTAEDYLAAWTDEWDRKKAAVGLWRGRAQTSIPERAADQAKAIIAAETWVGLEEVDVLRKCTFGIQYAPEIYVHVDAVCPDVYGVLHFYHRASMVRQLTTSFAAVATQSLNQKIDISVLGLSYRGNLASTRLIRTRIQRPAGYRIVASLLDQIRGIQGSHFPRCHPNSLGCSGLSCGYWRMCTCTPPKPPKRWRGITYAKHKAPRGSTFRVDPQ